MYTLVNLCVVLCGLVGLSYEQTAINVTCTAGEYQCVGQPTVCVPHDWLCDGDKDCTAGDDEDGCCNKATEFKCSSKKCIPIARHCDVFHDCDDGSDEANCTYPACAPNQFRCNNGHCLPGTARCDGTFDCGDASDETNCKVVGCSAGQLQCKNGNCIDFQLACNNNSDCSDNSDEEPCGKNHCADNGGKGKCSHECVNTLLTFFCKCPPGYQLKDDNVTCEDINECYTFPRNCSQTCVNTYGSYTCSCTAGFQAVNKTSCVHTDGIDAWIILANRYYIRKARLDGSNASILTPDHDHCHVLNYDYSDQLLYFADASTKTIKRIKLRGINIAPNATAEVLIKHQLPLIEGLAVDWIGKKMYWTDSTEKAIFVSETNGTNRKALLRERSPRPRAIVVHPGKGFFYWTDWSLSPFIARMGMDGSNFERLIATSLFWPNALTLDPIIDALWWGDAYLNRIEMSDLDGMNRHIVLENLPHIYSISVFEDMMFWTDWNVKTVYSANRFKGGKNNTVMVTSLQPYGIQVYHSATQPTFKNPCAVDNGGCSHLCLLAPGGDKTKAVCACPDYFNFTDARNKTCIPSCNGGQFLCGRSDHKCIPKRWQCDGDKDCMGGEDEMNCPNRTCAAGTFQCDNGTKCVYWMEVCDNKIDCADRSDEDPTMCAAECPPGEFKCTSGKCISGSWVCDGEKDCPSGNDENTTMCAAQVKSCKADEFTCNNGKCIDKTWRCDVDDDCGDNSDEEPRDLCRNTTCPAAWFRCKTNYRCIPELLRCDGDDDCRDNSDEDPAYCSKITCPAGDYQCKDGGCIPKRWFCDWDKDCVDGSDEGEQICQGSRPACTENEFKCDNERCVLLRYRCDNDNDCGDSSDEKNCQNHTCITGQFQCQSGHCINSTRRCDQKKDCTDFSDEIGCNPKFANGSYCTSDYFDCKSGICVIPSYTCDGVNDCALTREASYDESFEVCSKHPCNETYRYRCSDGRCIARRQFCDGIADCQDGYDENDPISCPPKPIHCGGESFPCNNGSCVSLSQVCNGKIDCAGGEDEKCDVTEGCSCDNATSSCRSTLKNSTRLGYCLCKPGFVPSLTYSGVCEDIDECAKWGNGCPQLCVNSKGNHTCDCVSGFNRTKEGSIIRCFPNDTFGPEILLTAVDNQIVQYDQLNSFEKPAAVWGRKINKMAVNAKKSLLYWTDIYQQTVYRTKIVRNATQIGIPEAIITKDFISNPDGIAVDFATNNIYISDSLKGVIYVAREDGKYVRTLYQDALRRPSTIAVNPILGKIYWIDELNKKIESANMDGSGNFSVIVGKDLAVPKGIVIDYYRNNRVFWTDREKDTIETVQPLGTDRQIVAKRVRVPAMLEVGLHEFFWTSESPTSRSVWKMSKMGTGVNVTFNMSYASIIADVKVFYPKKYPDTPSVRISCAHLTVVSPNKDFICLCADNQTDPLSSKCIGGDVIPLKEAEVCACVHGQCQFNATVLPHCKCDPGYMGNTCNESSSGVVGSTETPTPSSSLPTESMSASSVFLSSMSASPVSTASSGTTMKPTVGSQSTKGGPHVVPTPAPVTTKDNNRVAKIVIPIFVILGIILLIAIGVVIYRRRPDLKAKVVGKFRAGPNTNESSVPYETMDTPHFGNLPMVVEYEAGSDVARFSNPSYDQMHKDTTS